MVKKRELETRPPGASQSLKKRLLETGANLLQDVTPVKQLDIYVVGFHCARHDPALQMEAHHYCQQVNDDFLQCAIYDGNTKDANLIGIEYIISERLYNGLPEAEKPYWHPHNYEVFSGELVAPGLPEAAEKALMKTLINSYGKTWHTWHTGRYDGQGPSHELPLGEPNLMWSFNRDGEVDQSLKRNRDEGMGLDIAAKRRDRQEMTGLAHPQRGVDALKGAFPGASATPPPGVEEARPAPESDQDG